MKLVIFDGNEFSDLESFYVYIDKILTRDLDWKTGHNLDAFNDLLRGGFGVYDYKERIHLRWVNSEKSKNDLGFDETKKWLLERIKFHNEKEGGHFSRLLELTENKKGQTLYNILIEIILEHKHIIFETDFI